MPRVTDEHDSLCQHPTELAQHLDTGSSRQGNDCKGLWGGGKGGPLCSRLEAGGSRGAAPPTRGVPRGCGTVGVGEGEPLPPRTGLARSVHGEAATDTGKQRAPPPPCPTYGRVCRRVPARRHPTRAGVRTRVRVCATPRGRVQPGAPRVFTGTEPVCAAPSAHPARNPTAPRAHAWRYRVPRRRPPPPPCPAPRARAGRCRSLPAAAFWRAERQGRAGPAMSRPEPPPPAEPGAAIERLCQELNLDAASAAEALRDFTALRGTYSLEVRGPWPGPWPWRGGARRAAAPGGGRGEGARPRPGRPPPAASAARPRVRPPASACVHGRGGAAPGPAGGPGPPPPPAARRFPCPGRARRCTGWPAPSTSPAARAWCPPWGAA